MLIVILALIFALGWPLEWVPVVLPIVQATGIDLIWFCTLVAVGLLLIFPKLATRLPSIN
jgi:TRAP-type mannitol/chloroaromatic compound transport system permease large subunit